MDTDLDPEIHVLGISPCCLVQRLCLFSEDLSSFISNPKFNHNVYFVCCYNFYATLLCACKYSME